MSYADLDDSPRDDDSEREMSAGRRVSYNAPIPWRLGLISCAERYLTAEAFGFKINASGSTLKQKQIWTIETEKEEESFYFKSHLGR